MARIRNIKPDFFLDEDLANLGLGARLFFIGLWTHADKAGRLEDRPHKLKAVIFPWEHLDVEGLLNELDGKFICRYEVEGRRYVQVVNFFKHQRPHHTEAESVLPAVPKNWKPGNIRSITVNSPSDNARKGKGDGEGKGKGLLPAPNGGAGGRGLSQPKKLTPVQDIVELYKYLKGIGYQQAGDRKVRLQSVHTVWDSANFKLYVRAAAKLLKAFGGDVNSAKVYMTAKGLEWDGKGLDWQLQGIARHAVDHVAKEKSENAQADAGRALPLGQDVAGGGDHQPVDHPHGDSQRLGARGIASAGTLAGEVLRTLTPPVDDRG